DNSDLAARASTMERKLRALKREISGLAEDGKNALQDIRDTCSFEVRIKANLKDWEAFQTIWDELDDIKAAMKEEFPNETWQRVRDLARDEIREGETFLMRIQLKRNPQPYSLSNKSTLNSSLFNSNKPRLPRIPIPD
ncbi:hypothetical protein, partial [Klebsiella pneumoniae]|uniref:hypothetical protein n=1 Tax=Klebsiella pneumoniae TaxID=573 RepID=UPI00405582E7